MPGFGASHLELALEVGEGDIDIAHGHLGVDVAEQLHQNGEADAGAKHLRGVGMPELVGDDACGESEAVADPMQVIAELNNDGHFASRTCNEPSIGGQRIEGAEEAQTVNEVADEGIAGDHAFGLQLAEGNMDRPLVRAGGSQAVIRQIDAFADTHAGVAEEQEDISAEIVAAEQTPAVRVDRAPRRAGGADSAACAVCLRGATDERVRQPGWSATTR